MSSPSGAADRPRPTLTRPSSVVVVVPAKNEAERIGRTVTSARLIPGAAAVIVVDDGSHDATASLAHAAGAVVMQHARNRGKAAAMLTGARRAARLDAESPDPSGAPRALLFVDADLEDTAVNTAVLAAPVLEGDADMTIAVLPPQRRAGGGRGFVVRLSRWGIRQATGWTATQPLSGMRCLTRDAFEAALPLSAGWGVETGLTIDLLQAGLRVVEVPCELHHRVTGSDWHGQVHRAKQFRDVGRALATRRVRRAVPLSGLDDRP